MNKILEGAKEAVEVAKCDHDLVVQPRLTVNPVLERFYCTKCQATIYEPRTAGSHREKASKGKTDAKQIPR